ncbi:MAG: TonB-dependent receptor [Synoicihabitans sp.]
MGVLGAGGTASAQGIETGRVSGRVLDESSGFGVSGATVTVLEAGVSTTTDLRGGYTLSGVAAEAVDLVVAKDDFETTTITDLMVKEGEVTRLDIPLKPSDGSVINMEAFTIEADVVQSSDIGLLAQRQKAFTISDAISSDQLSRLGASDAAEALSKVTGASVVDGKYVIIRGLGDRYSNTLMNGVSVPSADPDKRAVQMDQFPSEMIESVVTTKSFTPDQPGAFSGGSVNLKTKSFPLSSFVSVSASAGMNDQVEGKDLLASAGNAGLSPSIAQVVPNRVTAEIEAEFFGNFEPAQEIDAASNAFGGVGLYPRVKEGSLNRGVSIAAGHRIEFGDEGLVGITASFNSGRSSSGYEGGEAGRFSGTPDSLQTNLIFTPDENALSFNRADVPASTPAFGVSSGTISESQGGLLKLAVRPTSAHEFSLDLIYNEGVDDTIRRGVGEEIANYEGAIYEVYDLLRTERSVSSAQLTGKSLFVGLNELEVEWRLSRSESTQDQPDYRTMAAVYDVQGRQVNATGVQPNRYFRELEETALEGGIDFSIPVFFGDQEHRLKFGGMASENERDYVEERFQYFSVPRNRDEIVVFPGEVGIVSQDASGVEFGNTISRLLEPNQYSATQDIQAFYGMMDLNWSDRFRSVIGARYESTEMVATPVQIPGLNPQVGEIDDSQILPAFNLTFAQNDQMNWRFAFGSTIARPTYKELSDIRYEDVFTNDVYLGNPNLQLTEIDNFDLRWEWFPSKGETIAVSAFYKDMSNPIEVLFDPAVGSIQPQNVESGKVHGVEFEFRRNLNFISDSLSQWSLGGNLTFIESEVSIPDTELAILQGFDAGASTTRDLAGQSPYVFNADINYSRDDWGSSATLSYNVVGERLDLVVFGPLNDVYEQPAPDLTFVWSQRLSRGWKMKFAAKNLLNSDREKTIAFAGGQDLVYSRYTTGRQFSLSVSYLFE